MFVLHPESEVFCILRVISILILNLLLQLIEIAFCLEMKKQKLLV